MTKGSRTMTHAAGPVSTLSIRVFGYGYNNVLSLMLEAMVRYG